MNIRKALFAMLFLLGAGTANADATPRRIVSMNLCADQLLMLLAERSRIVSVSHLAADPTASALAEIARGLPRNHGLAEEILPMDPDLVLAGVYTTRPTVFLLRDLGYRVVELPVASSLDDIRDNIRLVAAAVGEVERGSRLVAEFDARLSDLPDIVGEDRPTAALYWANGYTSGNGTLASAVIEAAGFRNLAADLGLSGTVQLPLETLVSSASEVLVIGRVREGSALANETLRHPVLRQGFADRPTISIPDYLWVCGTPSVVEAIERLAAIRLLARPQTSGGVGRR